MPEHRLLEIESPTGKRLLHVPEHEQHQPLSDLLRHAQLPLNTRCAGRGLCNGCAVELLRGSLIHIPSGQIVLPNQPPTTLRACEHRIHPDHAAALRLPARSLVAHQPFVVTDFRIQIPYAHCPIYQPPTPTALPRPVGAAVDIGTTTVVVILLDLLDGKILAKSAAFNQQMHLGDDVVTRITLCSKNHSKLSQLQDAVANKTIAPLLNEAIAAAGIAPQQLVCMTVAGNTTMLHLFAGVDPSPMGVAPFTPSFLEHRILHPTNVFRNPPKAALPCAKNAQIHLLPGAAAYVGADLIAGVAATGLLYDQGPSLLVDVGTNGEIILKYGNQLLGCATAAGPAFEGAGLSSGIRAGDGAISSIRLTPNPPSVQSTIINPNNHPTPAGLCGSAYIDFLAQARKIGLLTPAGRFVRNATHNLSDRLLPWGNHQNDLAFPIDHADSHHPIVISGVDIAHLLQAKAAIAAGILTLLKQLNLQPSQINKLYLAGGFGTHMNSQHAIDCGMLPGFRAEQVSPVGNSSLAGAYVAILDASILDELTRIGQQMRIVELNLDPDFETTYIDQLTLP